MRIAVAAQGFDADFQRLVHEELGRALGPGQSLLDCPIPRWDDPEFARSRLIGLLRAAPRPVALVGICIRPDAVALAGFRAAGVPVVLIDERAEGASTVAADNLAGGFLAGQHLVRAGRRSVAVVSGPIRDYNAMQRLRGVSRALSEGSVPLPSELLIEAPHYSHEDGVAAMGRLLDGPHRIDAIACTAGDGCAAGLVARARERQVRVPEDVAIVGYDDAPLAATTDPPLTTVSQSIAALAREALRLVTLETAAILAKPRTVLLEPRLVLRRSA
jgi:DNA-binding LacI/PurR family transcriptional regulator